MTSPPRDPLLKERQRVFQALESATGHSLELYIWKPFGEALRERMSATQIDEVDDYLAHLRTDPTEVFTLRNKALIGVTSFFRNPEAFEALRVSFLSRIIPLKSPGATLCVWVPGCSTGQEAYSLTMLLHEINEESGRDLVLRVVATDINPRAIAHARAGIYRSSELQAVPEHLRDRFFREVQGNCVAHPSLRSNLIFCVHDVCAPSPFRYLDLISCRNLLIYFQPRFQLQVLTSFKESLHAEGLLFLGASEGVFSNSDSFSHFDPKYKIFARRSPGFYH